MVTVNGGTFQMGDVMGDNEYPDEKPVHSVTLNSFQIGKYEVSQAEWVAVMGSNPSYFKGDNLPVEQVSWEDVQIYLEKLNSKTGKSYRLPTEAEWEYAAREGGKNRRFGNGKNTIDPSEINFNASADYKKSYSNTGTYRAKTVAVSSFSPNALGLYNMSGNVWEWCSDWYEKIITKTVPHLIRKARLRGLFAWFAAAAGTAIRRTAVPRIATPARLRTAATAWVSVWRPPFSETVCLSGFDLNFRNFGIAGIM